jgi:hypothetical protein
MSRWEGEAIVLTPLVAVATLALGLRVGASPAVQAAVVYGARPAADDRGLAWQIVTLVDDRGVQEAITLAHVSVVARARGMEARWDGSTNADGVAEVWLNLPGVSAGDAVSLEVRAPNERTPLASGLVSWPSEIARDAAVGPAFVRSSKREGDLAIDVAVYGGRLAPGFCSSLWVRVTDHDTKKAVGGVAIDAEPEPGLAVQPSRATSNASGYAELQASAEIHVAALGLSASAGAGAEQRSGKWYGAIPVAPGAAFVAMPLLISPKEPYAFEVVVPTVVPLIYAEVDDVAGRAFAVSLAVERSRVAISVPPLGPGTYWLVTSGDPRGAESLEGAAVARPFLVAERSSVDRASLGPRLALLSPPSFSRFVALDGLPGKRRADGSRHRRGLLIALGALGVAAVLEVSLILRAVARSKRLLKRLSGVLNDDGPPIERRFSAGSVVVGLLVALLGFALLATLLTWKAG